MTIDDSELDCISFWEVSKYCGAYYIPDSESDLRRCLQYSRDSDYDQIEKYEVLRSVRDATPFSYGFIRYY